jgi:hypothetical protein
MTEGVRRPILLFIVAVILAGAGGMLGSMAGNAAGHLYVGGVIGGLIGAGAAAFIAGAAGWIDKSRRIPAAIGAMTGFAAAALIAVNTLSSPIGPVLSTLLVGIGAVIGARAGTPR